MNGFPRISTTILLSILAAGCGGGGGGGGGGQVSTTGAAADIDTDNAQAISSDVFSGVMETGELGEFGALGGLPIGGGGLDGSLSKTAAALTLKSQDGLASRGLMQAAFGPEVTDCEVAGTITVSAKFKDPGTLSSGDEVSMSFDRCDNGDGETIDGDLSLKIKSFQGDFLGGSFAVNAAVDFKALSFTEESETNAVNGGFSLSIDTTDYPTVVFSHASDSLRITHDNERLLLADWITSLVVDESSQPSTYTLTAEGDIDVASHGRVSYEVLEPFTGFGDDHPGAGVLFIEGSKGGNITVTALSNTQVLLEMDYNGDGTVDEIKTVTWDELDD